MTDAVALVPGFWGFVRDDRFPYFSDDFVAWLGAALAMPVRVLTTAPTGSLAERQERLIAQLDADHRWHLVGHSAGGLDAALMLRRFGLTYDGERSRFSTVELDDRVVSAVALATPHLGT